MTHPIDEKSLAVADAVRRQLHLDFSPASMDGPSAPAMVFMRLFNWVRGDRVAAESASVPAEPRPQVSPADRTRNSWGWPLVLAAHAPLAFAHGWQIWRGGLHSHFPLVLLAFGGLLASRWNASASLTIRSPRRLAAVACGVLGFLVLAMATLLWSPWLGCVALWISLAGALLATAPCSVRAWLPVWCLLWLVTPAPFGLDRQLSAELQGYSARAASLMLDFFRVNHLRSGNILEIPGSKFEVEEACSGIHGLYVLVSFSAILAVWTQRSLLHGTALLIGAAAWASLANAIRVAGVVFAADRYQFDLATGWLHDLWGLTTFGGAILLLFSSDQFLWLVLAPPEEVFSDELADPEDDEDDRESVTGEGDIGAVEDTHSELSSPDGESRRNDQLRRHAWTGRQAWTRRGIAAAFALLFLGQIYPRGSAAAPQGAPPAVSLAQLSLTTMPATLAGWRRMSYETERRGANHSDGEFSAIWRFEREGKQAIVSLDFPFHDWHQLTMCYRGRGCQVATWERQESPAAAPIPIQVAIASLTLESGALASLAYVEWSEQGPPLTPPLTEKASLRSFREQLWLRWNRQFTSSSSVPAVYQLQVLETRRTPTEPLRSASTIELLQAAINVLYPVTTAAGGHR